MSYLAFFLLQWQGVGIEECIQDENIQIEVCILNWSQRPLCILYFAMCSHILSFSYGEVFPTQYEKWNSHKDFSSISRLPLQTSGLLFRNFSATATPIYPSCHGDDNFFPHYLADYVLYMYLALSTMESMGGCMGHDECLGFPFKYIFHLSLLSISFNILKIIF